MPTFSGLPEQITVDKDKYDELQAELDQPITEHPDVQRLIGQVAELQINSHNLQDERDNWVRSFEKLGTENIQLQAENKRLRNTIETLIDHEISCQHRGVGYDIFVHRESTIALKGE